MRQFGIRNVIRSLVQDRAGSALFTLLLMGILVLEFGSLEILHLEQYAPGANITSGSDAMWYVIVTISTVGYGDQFPVTNPGRLFGSLIIGVGIFGTFTGYLANLFLSPKKPAAGPSSADVDVQSKVVELKALMAQQQVAIADIDLLLQATHPDHHTGDFHGEERGRPLQSPATNTRLTIKSHEAWSRLIERRALWEAVR
jgi:voltage-gated potassium channel